MSLRQRPTTILREQRTVPVIPVLYHPSPPRIRNRMTIQSLGQMVSGSSLHSLQDQGELKQSRWMMEEEEEEKVLKAIDRICHLPLCDRLLPSLHSSLRSETMASATMKDATRDKACHLRMKEKP